MKQRLRKLFERVRRRPALRWPWSARQTGDCLAWLPADRTGWTVHRDIPLRLRSLGVDGPGVKPGIDAGAFKIRLSGSPESTREANRLVREVICAVLRRLGGRRS